MHMAQPKQGGLGAAMARMCQHELGLRAGWRGGVPVVVMCLPSASTLPTTTMSTGAGGPGARMCRYVTLTAVAVVLSRGAAAPQESCTWMGSAPTGTNCNLLPSLQCHASGGVTTVRYLSGGGAVGYPASFSQAAECRNWPATTLQAFPFSVVQADTLISYGKVSSSHVTLGWRYPAIGPMLVNCTVHIRVSVLDEAMQAMAARPPSCDAGHVGYVLRVHCAVRNDSGRSAVRRGAPGVHWAAAIPDGHPRNHGFPSLAFRRVVHRCWLRLAGIALHRVRR